MAAPAVIRDSLPPATAVILAGALAGCLWLALRPPRWLGSDRRARRFGAAMALVMLGGFLLVVRLPEPGSGSDGLWLVSFLIYAPFLVILPGSAVVGAVGRSFRAGLRACAWAVVLSTPLLIGATLVEALRWYQRGGGLLLDGEGGIGVGANLGDATWWPLGFLVLWEVPLGVLGAAVGRAITRPNRR